MKLFDLIYQSGLKALDLQHEDGAMPEGHNGLYQQAESPVRNTAHWLLIFYFLYTKTQEASFRQAALSCKAYLLSAKARPENKLFICRLPPHRDPANGLIGQAWVLEALAEWAFHEKDDALAELVQEIFLVHPYDPGYHAWNYCDLAGQARDFDFTFNHQLWFAAVGAKIAHCFGNEKIRLQVSDFMDHVPKHVGFYSNGIIQHFPTHFLTKNRLDHLIVQLKAVTIQRNFRKMLRGKSLGYHAFNMYGFALLKEFFPQHPFWLSHGFHKALKVMEGEAFWEDLEGNAFGYPYNPPGIEAAFAFQTFHGNDHPMIPKVVQKNLDKNYNFDQHLMNKNSPDPNTAAARLYEAIRIDPELLLKREA